MTAAGSRNSGNFLRRLVLALDLIGTAVFAAEGALTAAAAKLDLLGIAVIAFVTALGGGIVRDILLGLAPPAALRDGRYPMAVLVGACAALLLTGRTGESRVHILLIIDAAGLGLFTASGTEKALDNRSAGFAAVLLGTITATAGGALRDVLLSEVPAVLRVGFYATAAMIGAAFIVSARRAGAPAQIAAFGGGTLCIALRLLAVRYHWHLAILA